MDRLLGNIIAIVLTLLALVGLAYAGYNGFQNHKAGVVVNDVAQMITNARAGFSQSNNGYANFTTANVPAMINGGMFPDRKSTRLNSSHIQKSRMPSSA